MVDDGATRGTAGGPAGDGGTGDGQAAPGAPPPLISGDGGGGAAGAGGDSPGAGGEPWFSRFPEDLQTEKVKRLGSEEELLRSYVEAQTALGKKALTFGEDVKLEELTDEQRAQIYSALGRPEAPDGYEWSPPEGSGIELNEDAFKAALAKFHEAGMTPQQVSTALDTYAEALQTMAGDQVQARVQMRQDTLAALEEKFPDQQERDQQLVAANRALRHYNLTDDIIAAGMGDSLAAIELGLKLAPTIREPDAGPGSGRPQSVQERIDALKESPAWRDGRHADHDRVWNEYVRLQQQLHANE